MDDEVAAGIEVALRRDFPGIEKLVVNVDYGHFTVRIRAKEFNGIRLVAVHKMIYESIGKDYEVGGELMHALRIDAAGTE